MSPLRRAEAVGAMLVGRPVKVVDSTYYTAVKLINPNYDPRDVLVESAKSKLTAEELAALMASKDRR